MIMYSRFILLVIVVAISFSGRLLRGAEPEIVATAWRDGYPARGLHHADRLMAQFKSRANHLGQGGKLRVLIIGDSLSDGYYHWSHHFRRNLQAAYGNGGIGNIGATWHANTRAGWLFTPEDFHPKVEGDWRSGWGGRGDVWPYLGWNGDFLATESAEASYRLEATGSRFTVVTSAGTFETFNGQKINNQTAGFTVRLDDQRQTVVPARPGAPLDIALTRFEVPDGRHTLQVNGVTDGTLYLHGILVENGLPGVVVNNISHGGYWASNYLWRQPGWERILAEIDPDLTILFLTKPESGGSGGQGKTFEHAALRDRVAHALPRSDLLMMIGWLPCDGESSSDAQSRADRVAWCEANQFPYLDLSAGLDSGRMKELSWFADGIHLTPTGGEAIGAGVSRLFLP